MEQTASSFPFRKLCNEIYLILEVMMYVEYLEALKYIFYVKKESRILLTGNITSIINGFVNEGLIEEDILNDFTGF